MAEIKAEDKKKALEFLGEQKDEFRWNIDGKMYSKTTLVDNINEGSEFGANVVKLVGGFGKADGNALGKRIRCLICNTELLVTKGGPGKASCCDQDMVVLAPRLIPSSD